MVEGSGFENRRIARYQGFESLRLRNQTPSGGLIPWRRIRGNSAWLSPRAVGANPLATPDGSDVEARSRVNEARGFACARTLVSERGWREASPTPDAAGERGAGLRLRRDVR